MELAAEEMKMDWAEKPNPGLEISCSLKMAKFGLDSHFILIFFFNDAKTKHLLWKLNVLMIQKQDATPTLG